MAKRESRRWTNLRVSLDGTSIAQAERRGRRRNRARPKGITNAQAKDLARLQRQLGEPYSGAGMTARQAADAIRARRAQLEVAYALTRAANN
jgi:hypothetical protein